MHVYQVLAPARFGGAETVCLSLAAALGAIGVGCTVVVLVAADVTDALLARAQRLGLTVVVLRHGRRGYHRDVLALRRLVARGEGAILHSHLARANLVARGAAALTRRPCVATHHGHFAGSVRGRVYDLADLNVLRTMERVVAVSHAAAVAMRSRSPRLADRCVVVPSALLPDAGVPRASARALLGVGQDATVIGWVGRFAPQKHPELFVRSVAEVARNAALADPWQAVMLGDGPSLSAARELAHTLGVADRVTFSGFHADAGRLVSAFDALAITSRGEELPTVLLESLHHGVPVASTAVGDVPYIAERCSAVRLADADPTSFASVLAELLSTRTCRPTMARLGMAYVADHHAPAAWAERHRELYTRILEGRTARAPAVGSRTPRP
jgi:glycosyltransferase involved in cell wall biosynthesis